MTLASMLQWEEGNQTRVAHWHSENGIAPHKRVVIADDTLTADDAYRLACEGTAILWRGDFQNARQLLQALVRRIDKPSKKSKRAGKRVDKSSNEAVQKTATDIFNQHRLIHSQRARILGMLLIECNADHTISLRRAPDVSLACLEAYGAVSESYVISLRELLGVISAHEWRKNGVPILADSEGEPIFVHPHYGVFSPVRGEYIELICNTPLPKSLNEESIAFDIGVGTGVLSIILALRGVQKIVATDMDERALVCAQENIEHLELGSQVEIVKANLFPEGRASLVVCNPPWLPARPSSSLEHAVYDPDSRMLKGFLNGLSEHVVADGEGWLILSDLAEHLGLRTRKELLEWIEQSGLVVLGRVDTRPKHPKASSETDLLYFARSAEVTSLWRLGIKT
ncbi:class I SAM-dependent methyltransferase [Polynucleobacter sp. AP-Nino-20-G2]|uniref:50S ribosomal protein L11 methyltransferase n=1 Tax=Polynucleobacter sp. AP-Nino-20-G2 TaxID=2576917 RepID=UPI001BFDA800|nr:class I SAM-dependent methyltransferase [Polynucleobacter sp. AP-Nino-20-G2]QWE16145.1 class I SAM-dependent methyltransferase [Polynucleobacter sp. AP-Nino-20-G2]